MLHASFLCEWEILRLFSMAVIAASSRVYSRPHALSPFVIRAVAEGGRAGVVGAYHSSAFGQADKTRDAVRDKLRPLFNNVMVRVPVVYTTAVMCPIFRQTQHCCTSTVSFVEV